MEIMKFIVSIFIFVSVIFFDQSYAFCFKEAGREYSIDWKFIKAISMTESSLRHNAVNYNKDKKGNILSVDRGLMQINSSVWFDYFESKGISKEKLIKDPCANVKAGSYILKQHFAIVGKRNWYAVGTYNAGFRKSDLMNKRRNYYINKVKKNLNLLTKHDANIFK